MAASKPRQIALIITALPVEYQAVRSHLAEITEQVHPQGTIYETGTFEAGNGVKWEVSVVEIGAGNPGAALETERAIAHLRPSVAFFVGVAGGIKDVMLCDIVAATKVYGYECGKQQNCFEPRPNVGESSYSLVQRARAEARKGNWRRRIRTEPPRIPQAFLGPIAAGEKVLTSTTSDLLKFLRSQYGDALAIEMEGRGFLQATHANQAVSALIVRGISDFIDEKGQHDHGGYQQFASACASAFTFEILANFGSLSSGPGRFVLVLSGSVKETDRPRVEAIVSHLKSLSEDMHLTLEKVEGGSIKLFLIGNREGYERLGQLHRSGELSHHLGIAVLSLSEFEDTEAGLTGEDRHVTRLLLDARRGVPEALEEFVQNVYFRLRTPLFAYVNSKIYGMWGVDAGDLVQETFITAFQQFERFQGATLREFRTWVFKIARGHVINVLRRQAPIERSESRRETQSESKATLSDWPIDPSGSPRDAMETAEIIGMITQWMRQLTPEQQRIISLLIQQFPDRPSVSAIAEQLGMSSHAVRYGIENSFRRFRSNFKFGFRIRELLEGLEGSSSDIQTK